MVIQSKQLGRVLTRLRRFLLDLVQKAHNLPTQLLVVSEPLALEQRPDQNGLVWLCQTEHPEGRLHALGDLLGLVGVVEHELVGEGGEDAETDFVDSCADVFVGDVFQFLVIFGGLFGNA